ncbi:MAG: aminotransferase class I/II-fold pyridoxal phosphate-dependent enzyme [Anaerolineaceae bacterium]|nr:aminotransferase class I/II-fold pyridoxal phosphate-dependent enzyme [Anaerolineaceae bacterium]
MVFSSGMAAVSSAVLARTRAGQTIIAQESLYGTTFTLLSELAPRYGIKVVWLKDTSPDQWERAFSQNPEAVAAYIETPVNPTMAVVDIARISEIAHRYGAWVIADNTFATPFCQRPLTLGVDVVVHSTTKYISGHGLTIGGAVVSRHVNFINKELNGMLKMLGGVCSPMDAWLANNGLKTFELRMQRHCDNGLQIARYLEQHPAVEHVYYPGLPGHPDHELAKRQMLAFGGMLSFELKGGLRAGEDLMNRIKVMSLAVSLGNVDTLIQHPASMSHSNVPREVRIKAGLSDGLVRLSVGIENCEDLIADFEQAFGN